MSQFDSCVCLCANYSSVVRVPPDDLSFSSIWGNEEKWLFQYHFLPVHTLVGRRSPTCISLNEGQGPKGKRPSLWATATGAGKKLLTQKPQTRIAHFLPQTWLSNSEFVSRKNCNLLCSMYLLPNLWLMFTTSLSNIYLFVLENEFR
jgi:hypothetical protein